MDPRKLKKLSLQDFIKDNSPSRLKSLRLPRDLSLGGTKCKKHLYKPNLNAVRNKFKLRNNDAKPDKSKKKFDKEVNKNRFIQSTGIFSEGNRSVAIATLEKKRYVNDLEKTVNKTEPVIRRSNRLVIKEKPAVTTQVKDIDDDSDNESETPEAFKPVHFRYDEEHREKVKPEPEMDSILPPEFSVKNEANFKPTMTLWQLPDALPIKMKKTAQTKQQMVDHHLSDFPDGQIGRICVRKSGKIEVFVGDMKCQLDTMNLESFKEEFVSLDGEARQCTILAEIGRRFILKPDLKSIF